MSLPVDIKRGSRKVSISGRMNRKVAIYTVTATTDSQGGGTEAEALTRTVWGAVEPMTGSKALQYGQLTNGKPYTITIIKPSDLTITEANYLIVESKTLAIHSVIEIELDGKYLEIIAYEKV